MLTEQEVLTQSRSAYNQWAPQWREHAAKNGKFAATRRERLSDLYGRGIGKRVVIVAMGASLEESMPEIIKHRGTVDVLCVDKALGPCIEHGVVPDYVVLMDANVSWEKYGAPYAERAKSTKLIMNVNGNPEWSHGWQGAVYFAVNKDNIQSEREFSAISGIGELVPAGSNVGNGAIIVANAVLDYDVFFLAGYDASWRDTDNYYAYGDSEKRHWMAHHVVVDVEGQLSNTSSNLLFSARWIGDYIAMQMRGKTVINCSRGIVNAPAMPIGKALAAIVPRAADEKRKQNALFARARKAVVHTREQLAALLDRENVVAIECKYLPREATA